MAFSPDGQRIVTGSGDQTAKVWEAASGKELLTLKGHSDAIWSVAFSPDGQRIVTGSRDQTAKVWEAASGKELLTLKGHSGSIWSVAFSPDGQRIVTGSEDQTAKVWEAASWPGTAHAQGAQRWGYVCGLFPGRPADCHWQSRSDGQSVGGGASPSRSLPGRKKNGRRLSILPPWSASGRPSRSAKSLPAPVILSSSG